MTPCKHVVEQLERALEEVRFITTKGTAKIFPGHVVAAVAEIVTAALEKARAHKCGDCAGK